MDIFQDIKDIKGIGAKKAAVLHNMNIYTVEDLYSYYPRTYQDRRVVKKINNTIEDENTLLKVFITRVKKDSFIPRKRQITRLTIEDETGSMEAIFFNASYLAKSIKLNTVYDFYGKVTYDKNRKVMIHPEISISESNSGQGILPVYPLVAGITQKNLLNLQKIAYKNIDQIQDYMPQKIIDNNRLCSLSYAYQNIHFPGDAQKLKEARYRLIFDELMLLQTGLLALGRKNKENHNGISFDKTVNVEKFIESFRYEFTNAQKRVVHEIIKDMESDNGMNRLVQGDVGSGKTAVAEVALFKAVKSGYQGVLMAPTDILARQHFKSISEHFAQFDIEVGFLSGSMSGKEKNQQLEKLKSGQTQVLIGTHAIIQDKVIFKNLGLVITDEQHRFGVNQRSMLTRKGNNPDILVMTATPIPRTLAVILYGDMEVSIINELPKGRQKIITRASGENDRNKAYNFVKSELKNGRQAYVVAPLIEDSEVVDARSVENIFQELIIKFNEYNVALLHGSMKQKEKDEIMEKFNSKEIDLLISTVVIEVGINVPNATVMVIENAERFGLAQLHQLRGRVGRGKDQSYCILITDSKNDIARERAGVMISTTDGFEIAEKDLILRGAGEFFGTKQHGLPELKLADLSKHFEILNIVRQEAGRLLDEDKNLEMAQNAPLKAKIDKMFDMKKALNI